MYPIIHLAEGLDIPSFFLVISLVLSAALLWVTRRSGLYQLPKKKVLDLSFLLMVSAFLGGRLMHVFYENFSFYRANPFRIFYIWEGGFVYYGGMVLATCTALIYLHLIHAPKKGDYFDTFAPVLAFTYGFGRIGCFLAGCCYGKTCDYAWAVAQRHPTQLYAFLWEGGTILLLLGLEKVKRSRRPFFLSRAGDLFLFWLVLHALGRLLMESFREDFRGEQILGLSVSSLVSLLLLVIVLLRWLTTYFLEKRARQ